MVDPPCSLVNEVTVVIPTHNRKSLLPRALHSVLAQSLKPLEILVIDDGSSDNTHISLAQKFPAVIWISQSNHGVSHARNTGVRMARGQWIAFLDSDDLWDPNKLDKQNEFLRKNPDLRFCHTEENWIRNGKEVSPPAYLDKSNHEILEKSLHRCIICPSSVVMHKNIFSEVGYFDESMPVCEDYDLWLRILIQYNIGLLDQKLVTKFGGHSDQLSKAYWGMDRFRVQTLQKLLNHSILTPSQKSSVLRVLIEKLEILAKGFTNRKKLCEAEKFIDLKASFIQQLQSVAQG